MHKNRKIISVIVAVAVAATAIFSSSILSSGSKYNDVTYRSYVNLSENSDIPSLFRNDSVFTSYKSYPPVISDGLEYVPLELFYGLSNIKISYSKDASNFYIQNKKNNKYISFNISDKYAVTNDNRVYEIPVQTFYGIHYVPLRTVCSSVGLGCDSYNDGVNKVYAIKVYNVAGLSAKELVEIHAPGIYAPAVAEKEDQNEDEVNSDVGTPDINTKPEESTEVVGNPEEKEDTTDTSQGDTDSSTESDGTENNVDSPQTGNTTDKSTEGNSTQSNSTPGNSTPGNSTKPPVKNEGGSKNEQKPSNKTENKNEDKKDKEQEKPVTYKEGTVMLFYPELDCERIGDTLGTLSKQGVKSTFFVTEREILEHPEIIREIYASGHTLGITFDESPEELYVQGVFEQRTESAENALYEVAKTKTRVVYLPKDNKNFDSAEIEARADAMGLCTVEFNGDSGTDYLNADKASAKMAEALKDIPASFGGKTAYISMSHTASGNAVVGVVAEHVKKHSQLKLGLFNETTK